MKKKKKDRETWGVLTSGTNNLSNQVSSDCSRRVTDQNNRSGEDREGQC